MDYSLEISCEDQANASLDTMPSRHQLSTVLKYVKIEGFNLERVPVFLSSGRRGWMRNRKKNFCCNSSQKDNTCQLCTFALGHNEHEFQTETITKIICLVMMYTVIICYIQFL